MKGIFHGKGASHVVLGIPRAAEKTFWILMDPVPIAETAS